MGKKPWPLDVLNNKKALALGRLIFSLVDFKNDFPDPFLLRAIRSS
jgi:hypothetical protein